MSIFGCPVRRQHGGRFARVLLAVSVVVSVSTLVACGKAAGPAPADRASVPPTALEGPAIPGSAHQASPSRDAVVRPPAIPGAARRRDLAADELRGGHTLSRHVGRSDDQLRQRLRRESISAASTFTDRETAELTVAAGIERDRSRVTSWQRRSGPRPNLALRYRGSRERVIGRSLAARAGAVVACYDAVIVLRWDEERDDYYVLTAYPEAR
ncbi:MAG: RNase A-like domain-containing protein [Vicinamibacterales bacterium]